MKAFFLVIAAVASVIRSAPEWHYCYECSGQSALCRDSVYDGQYLSKTACSSTCFLRYEGETIYRGCFDGWLGGMVDHEYQGCQTQEYLGEQVEWCFCKGYDEEPCNSASRDDLSKLGPPEVKETPQNISEVITKTIKENLDTNSTDVKDVKEEFLHEIPEIAESPTDYDYKEETGLDEPLNSDGKINPFQIRYEDQRQAPLEIEVVPSSLPSEEITVDDGGYGVEHAAEASKLAANLRDSSYKTNEFRVNHQTKPYQYQGKPVSKSGHKVTKWMCTEEDGSYPDPDDCAAYYQCSHGRPYHMRCGAGTVWNDALKGCSFTYTTAAPCRMPLDFKRVVSVWAGYTPWQYMGYNFHNVATDDPPSYLRSDKKLYETFYGDYNAV